MIGTSTCIIGITPSVNLVPGVCGVVQGSVDPQRTGIEAGLSAVGDIFGAIAARAGTDVKTLSQGLEKYRAGQTGLLRLAWDNGDRTVLVNPNLRGITLGWNLTRVQLKMSCSRPSKEPRCIRASSLTAWPNTACTFAASLTPAAFPRKTMCSTACMPMCSDGPCSVPTKSVTSLGSAIFAFLAAGIFKTVEEAQD